MSFVVEDTTGWVTTPTVVGPTDATTFLNGLDPTGVDTTDVVTPTVGCFVLTMGAKHGRGSLYFTVWASSGVGVAVSPGARTTPTPDTPEYKVGVTLGVVLGVPPIVVTTMWVFYLPITVGWDIPVI